MTFVYQRSYRGKVQAALLDWAGTTMDFGCMAPAVVFVKVFERAGVPISRASRVGAGSFIFSRPHFFRRSIASRT